MTGKVLTTPADPLVGVLNGLAAFEEQTGDSIAAIQHLVHATTLAINTLIERKGAVVSLLTTKGFRDVIETGREDKYDLYDLQIDLHRPLVERERRIGIPERMSAKGEPLHELDCDALREAVARLPADTESIAVCFLHSYANGRHEAKAARVVSELRPQDHLSLSSQVAPVIREYERFTATVVNAYVGPTISGYVGDFHRLLTSRSFVGSLEIMKSDGGMCAPADAQRFPVRVLESGPAAGIISSARTAVECGCDLVLAFDMGGTTAKACLIEHGQAVITDELEVARLARFRKGSGIPIHLPSLDLTEIGAGGGSIASIDEIGLLQVGPESAGAQPGPACYGTGGERPTVTDADLLLGYLNPDYFAGGLIDLDIDAARRAIECHMLRPTGAEDITTAAWGIYEIVNENMARAIRLHCLEHGVDPSAVTLVATGGAGPVHAAAIMMKLGSRHTICPRDVGVASALGLLVAPRSVEKTITSIAVLGELGVEGVKRRLRALGEELRSSVTGFEGFVPSYFLHMRLRGQAYAVRVPLPLKISETTLEDAFRAEYTRRFGRPPTAGAVEIANWTAVLTESRMLPPAPRISEFEARPPGRRRAYFGPAHGWLDVPTVAGGAHPRNEAVTGPLLIEEPGSTIVINPGQRVLWDELGNVHIEVDGDD